MAAAGDDRIIQDELLEKIEESEDAESDSAIGSLAQDLSLLDMQSEHADFLALLKGYQVLSTDDLKWYHSDEPTIASVILTEVSPSDQAAPRKLKLLAVPQPAMDEPTNADCLAEGLQVYLESEEGPNYGSVGLDVLAKHTGIE